MNKPSPLYSQMGVTLVELMIGMTVGLIVLAFVSQIYLSGRQSYRTQTGFGSLQENGRFALYFLQRDLRMAGFPRTLGPGNAPPVLDGFVIDTSPEEVGMTRILGEPATCNDCKNGSDQIVIRYNSFGDLAAVPAGIPETMEGVFNENNDDDGASRRDCLGQEVLLTGQWSTVEIAYFVDMYTPPGEENEVPTLYCHGNGGAGSNPQPIIPGVESFQVLYGQDTDGDGYANIYLNASEIVGDAQWRSVASVRIGLLINSQEPIFESPDTEWYTVLDADPVQAQDISSTALDERRFARRVFTTTIQLRNRSPE